MANPQQSGSKGDGPAPKAKTVASNAGSQRVKGGVTPMQSVKGGPRPQQSGSSGG